MALKKIISKINKKTDSKIKGFLDRIDGLYVVGWAWDPEKPEERLKVVVYVDGEPVAEGVADQYREDLERAGIGDGRHGFRIKLPEEFFDGKEHEIKIKVKIEDNEFDVGKPLTKTLGPLYKIEGNLDGIDGLYVVGWAWEPENPEKRLKINVYVDGILSAESMADIYREDLKYSGIGDGKYGFRIPLPNNLVDGKEHEIKVIVNGYELPGSPKYFKYDTKYASYIHGLKGHIITGKVTNIIKPEEPVTVELWENSKFLSSAVSEPHNQHIFTIYLPKEVMDGRPHLFEVRTGDGVTLGFVVDIVKPFLTPFEVLKIFSKSYPNEFDPVDKFRFKAFLKNLGQIVGDGNLSPEEKEKRIKTLNKVLEIVSQGYENIKMYEILEVPKYEKPEVSIVIPVHNKFELTYCCIASIILASYVPYEIIIVDDGSSDKTLEIKEIIKNIKLIRNETAQGFLKACNKGAQNAEGEYIVILNNDTEVLDGWLNEMLWIFKNYERVGLVGAKLLYPDLTLQEAGGIVWGNGQAWNYGRNGNQADPKYNYVRQVDYCSGACIMLPKKLWEELGGFDEEFVPAYWEETDLAFRVRERGYKVVYTPFAQVIHYEGMSCGKDVKSGVKQYQAINQVKFKRKWAHVLIERKNENSPSLELADIVKDRGIIGRVLCIDYEVPRPDREAGGYATFQEIKLFQSLGYKVTFVPANMAYLHGYVEDLQKNGVEVIYAPFYYSVHEFIEKRGKEFDIFYIVRWHVAKDYIDLIRSVNPSAKILFNNADLHFLRELREAIATNNKDLLVQAIDTREKELEVMRKVDLVLSYNEAEHAVIISHNLDSTKVAKWPWVVYLKEGVKPFEERDGIAFLGNYRHFPNISAVRFFVEKVMPLLRKEIPDIKFYVYGAHMPEEFKKEFDFEDVILKGYVKSLDEVFYNCKIFVAPLLSGAGIKGKVIEALSYGMPSVLSPIAAEATGIRNGFEAFIVEKPEEYVEAIVKLYNDKKLWQKMRENALNFVKAEYSFERGREIVRRALEMVDIYVPKDVEGFYVRRWDG